MNYAIKISEETINKIFLTILPMNDRDDLLFKGNNAKVLRKDELEEISNNLKVGDNITEAVFEIVERAIYDSSIDLNSYSLPSKLRLVDKAKPKTNEKS